MSEAQPAHVADTEQLPRMQADLAQSWWFKAAELRARLMREPLGSACVSEKRFSEGGCHDQNHGVKEDVQPGIG